jgi:hypothetical protein
LEIWKLGGMSDEKLKNEDVDPVDVPLIISEDRAQSPCFSPRLHEQDDRIRGFLYERQAGTGGQIEICSDWHRSMLHQNQSCDDGDGHACILIMSQASRSDWRMKIEKLRPGRKQRSDLKATRRDGQMEAWMEEM